MTLRKVHVVAGVVWLKIFEFFTEGHVGVDAYVLNIFGQAVKVPPFLCLSCSFRESSTLRNMFSFFFDGEIVGNQPFRQHLPFQSSDQCNVADFFDLSV